MTSHFDTQIALRQKGERLLRKKTSMVTMQSFVWCEKTTHCDRMVYIVSKIQHSTGVAR
jgi:hypothetical protein